MPVLIAWSDNGTEMTAIDTRKFMALMAITQHHGRPGTPTDQAHIESFFSHLKGDWPHLTTIRDPAVLDSELARVRREYNTVRLHAAVGYVTPDDEHHGRGPSIRRARAAGMRRARAERIAENRASKHDQASSTPTAPVPFWGRGALLRGSLAGHGWPAKWARTTPIPPPPTGPTTALSVWLKKSAALSRTQKHRIGLLAKPRRGVLRDHHRQAIRRGSFDNVKQLIAAIGAFIDAYNDRCRPFVWTKTPDDILPRATRQSTSDARHQRGPCQLGTVASSDRVEAELCGSDPRLPVRRADPAL